MGTTIATGCGLTGMVYTRLPQVLLGLRTAVSYLVYWTITQFQSIEEVSFDGLQEDGEGI